MTAGVCLWFENLGRRRGFIALSATAGTLGDITGIFS